MWKDNAYLADILNAGKSIQRFVEGRSERGFPGERGEVQEAVNRKFEIIGEAARHLSPVAKVYGPQIPWKLISAMRNILIHNYDDVDLNIVWDTTQRDVLTADVQAVEAYLAKIATSR